MELDLMNFKKRKKIERQHGSTLQVFKGHLPKEGVQTGGSEEGRGWKYSREDSKQILERLLELRLVKQH